MDVVDLSLCFAQRLQFGALSGHCPFGAIEEEDIERDAE